MRLSQRGCWVGRCRQGLTGLVGALAVGTALGLAPAHADDVQSDSDLRDQMRELITGIAETARAANPDFFVVTQNGLDLMTRDGDPEAPLADYAKLLDGVSQEGVSYGFDGYCERTPREFHRELLQYLERAREMGLAVLLTDYCNQRSAMERATGLARERRFISFVSRDTDFSLSSVPRPVLAPREGNVTELVDARNYLYLLNPERFESPRQFVRALSRADFDVIVMDAFFGADRPLTPEEIDRIRRKPDGGSRILLAYMNVGAVENWRYYWQEGWRRGSPDWIGETYSEDYPDEYWANYWRPEWHEILYSGETSYLKRILSQGFDGVFLDNIDAYEIFEE